MQFSKVRYVCKIQYEICQYTHDMQFSKMREIYVIYNTKYVKYIPNMQFANVSCLSNFAYVWIVDSCKHVCMYAICMCVCYIYVWIVHGWKQFSRFRVLVNLYVYTHIDIYVYCRLDSSCILLITYYILRIAYCVLRVTYHTFRITHYVFRLSYDSTLHIVIYDDT
jgi:hypothetical protein